MKHALIYLDYQSNTESNLLEQLKVCGVPLNDIQLIIVRERGIANAINTGFRKINNDIGLITILANDINEPDNWLKKREDYCKGNIGICSFRVSEPKTTDGGNIIGNYTIQRDVLIRVGAMDTSFDPYGAIDLDYCVRTRAAGFKTEYILSDYATHLSQEQHQYGFDKAEMVAKTWMRHAESVDQFMNGKLHYFKSL